MKMQLQKLSSILLGFVMLIGLLPTTALAADTYTVTVNGGTDGGDYAEGASVTITANAPENGK